MNREALIALRERQQGFCDGFIAAFALKGGHHLYEQLRDEYLARSALIAQQPETEESQ